MSMSATPKLTAQRRAFAATQPRQTAERLPLTMLWLTGASSAIVFFEPSPYEISSMLAIVVFAFAGLTMDAALLPMAALLLLINFGYTISASSLFGESTVLTWIITSWYLGVTAVFFASVLCANTEARLDALMRGTLVAGVISSLIGVGAYFHLFPGSDQFLLYERARGTFKDPNVFGAFIVLPALLALRNVVAGEFWTAVRNMLALAVIAAAGLLSFSRGAWGQLVATAAFVLLLMFLTTQSPNRRLRIVLMTGAGVVAVVMFLAALMSIDLVANLMKQRLSLEQNYDMGEQGRFGRHALGALLALDVPLGIGPLQFSKIFPEDPHNSYLNAFMSGGWISGLCYPTLMLLTTIYGMRYLFVPTPWQSTMIVVYAAYVGAMAESFIIDTDHWRHVLLLLGVIWGLIAATRAAVHRADAQAMS